MKNKRVQAVLLALVAAGMLVLVARRMRDSTPSGPASSRPVAVNVEPVQRVTLADEANFTGTLRPRSRFLVAPNVSGRLHRLAVDMGDYVQRGDLIALLESEEYEQHVAQAEAELDVARAALLEAESSRDVARNDLERITNLHQEQVASDAQLDESRARFRAAEARVEVARAQIRQREAALRSAQARLAYTRLLAVWDGPGDTRRIAERYADEGDMLRANDPVVSIIETTMLLAEIFAIERDFPLITPGQPARLRTDAFPGEVFEGRVIRRAPALDERSRHARVEIEVPNPDDRLAPGMFVRVTIRFAEHIDTLAVPLAAVVRRNGQSGVFRVSDDGKKALFTPIRIGVTDRTHAQVLEPELDGRVVTLGHHLLEDGGAITFGERGGGDAR